jgi:hypothetical protein
VSATVQQRREQKEDPRAEDAGQRKTDEVAGELLGIAGAGEGVGVVAKRSDLLEGVVLLPPVEEVEHRRAPDGQMQLVVFSAT